ncbi:MAG: pyruvate:ferredoxin (flavodoxin) oxidoreductase, partial [Actinomyces sp.]
MTRVSIDGNEAAASVAYRASEVIAIYPITPASPMGELADSWAAAGRTNVWGTVPEVMEMQSEAGAAGAVHGSVQAGALTTTFTASQGLLLMIPDMYKIAGELTPAVFHVAARSVATHALSIFGDHSDVMATRATGWALLASASPQEAHDLAAVAHAATLTARVPFLHFFDGFRTSHEINTVELIDDDDLAALLPLDAVLAHRNRRLDPERPVLRGSAQNPDVFFQAREAANPFHDAVPTLVQETMDRLAARVGRHYHLVDYVGAPDADTVVVQMGSGTGATREAVERLTAEGRRVGLVIVRLYRPFPTRAFLDALPPTVRTIAVLDRTKEPGAVGEPLLVDVAATVLAAAGGLDGSDAGPRWATPPRVIGGRYGLSSKEYTPAMAVAVFDEAARPDPRPRFTVGIVDDVTHLSLDWDRSPTPPRPGVTQAVFVGLGSDGTVGANKNTVKIVGDRTDLHAQGYFVYDSRKAGSMTTSHLRFAPEPVASTYLIGDAEADFVGVHQFVFLERFDPLRYARPGATVLLNAPGPAEAVWDRLPVEAQETILERRLDVHVVDAQAIADANQLGRRVNTILQTCFFALTDLLPVDEAVTAVKDAIRHTYGRFGETVLARNEAAVDAALDALVPLPHPDRVTATRHRRPPVPADAPDFVQRVTARMIAGEGDLLPVSALPVDGTFPTGTTRWEKRSIALEIPIFDPELCIECAKCAIACPHAAIRIKAFPPEALEGAPPTFKSRPLRSREMPDHRMTVQVAPDDCTGCGVCVEICPARSKEIVRHKAIDMEPKEPHLEAERANWAFFEQIPTPARAEIRLDTVKGSQLAEPLFEFSGACAGCGETPYLKLLTQLFGDRILVANATGCSSIYGGNLPTTPWAHGADGRGPAWANSLFEDDAEFGLGMRLALDRLRAEALLLAGELAGEIGDDLVTALADAPQFDAAGVAEQRNRVAELRRRLAAVDDPRARRLDAVADALIAHQVWIVGGDGWAYDIGFGGLDHVLASGRDVNILVLDTQVYSNTGGQASKATPRAAVAKFAASGKAGPRKDLGQIAMAYEDVYVAEVALGANQTQTVKAFAEAASFPGPSLIVAYSTCIAHGIDMSRSMTHQKELVESGFWPLYRYDPRVTLEGKHAFHLDSRRPSVPFVEVARQEARFAMLERSDPERAARLAALAQADIDERWRLYEQFEDLERTIPD